MVTFITIYILALVVISASGLHNWRDNTNTKLYIHTPVLYSKPGRCYLRYYTIFAIIAEVRFIRDSVIFIIFNIFNGSVMNRSINFAYD